MTSHPLSESSRSEWIRRILIYGVAILVLATAQCSFFSRLHLLPATPDLMLALVLCVLLLDSPYAALAVALGAGYVIDALGSATLFLSPIFYVLCVLILRAAASKMLSGLSSYALLLFYSLWLRAGYTVLCMTVMSGKLPPFSAIPRILLPEMAVTTIFALILFPLIKRCIRLIRSRNRFRF